MTDTASPFPGLPFSAMFVSFLLVALLATLVPDAPLPAVVPLRMAAE